MSIRFALALAFLAWPAAQPRIGARRDVRASPAPPVITITAREYAFDGPASIESGPTTFRLVSRGREQHFLGLVKIDSPHTLADYRRVLTAARQPSWVTSVGGVGTLPPGGIATTTINLEAGLYAMLCDMTDLHGVPHMMEGMFRALTVVPRGNGTVMPTPDVEVDLAEFAFVAPAKVKAGPHVIGVRNRGTRPHMVLVWRLAPGSSVGAVAHWLDTPSDTSHPVTLVGGVPDLAPGRTAQLLVRLEPGRYVLICLVSDPGDPTAHYDKGMVKELAVVP